MRIHRLRDPIYTSNVYVIDAKRPVLVDTGGALTEEILSLVGDALRDRPLQAIVFTHGHPDHIGGAGEVAQALGVSLFIHAAELDVLPIARPLGDVVDCGDVRFEVLHTPGHSPGGVSFYDRDSGILISGDTVFPGGRVGRWDLPGSDYDALHESLKRMNSLSVSALYPGHYDPVGSNVAAHLKASLETIEAVGRAFDDERYDERIERLQGSFTEGS
jgi:glyoxylase-like metal-dependent hydrolase (beta-lactamase superfamily II)